MNDKVNTGRFTVGQKLIVVAFTYATKSIMFCNVPLLHDNEMPEKIHLKELTVTEHHKVAWHYDEKKELKYDGYILKDAEGIEFHNQYPHANYGQTTDNCDRQFRLACGDKDEAEELIANSKEKPLYFELLEVQLDRMFRGIDALSEGKDSNNPRVMIKVEQLKELFNQINTELAKDFPNVKYERISPYPEYPEIKRTSLTNN